MAKQHDYLSFQFISLFYALFKFSTPFRSSPFHAITCGGKWGIIYGRGLFAVHFGDHLRRGNPLLSGIICITEQPSHTYSDNMKTEIFVIRFSLVSTHKRRLGHKKYT